MSVISAGTTTTTAFKVTGDTTGTLQLKTGAVPTTAIDISATQVVTFPATTTLDFTGTLRLSGGTANGVLYLNGSKDVTGGSTLTFDGTTFTSGAHTLSTGVLTVPAGTVSAPAITTSGDTNTGIYFPAADTIAFAEGGVEALRIDSSANVGIGTSSPTYKLDVSSSGGSLFRLARGSVSFGTFLGTSDAFVGTFSNNNLVFITNDTAKAILDSSGNLGLGVTPAAWALSGSNALQVKNAGFAGYLNNAYVAANQYFTSAGGSNYIANGFASMYIQQSGQHQFFSAPSGTAGNTISFTQAMTLDASGNLGVGATSPLQRLDARGAVTIGSSSTTIGVISRAVVPSGSQGMFLTANYNQAENNGTLTWADTSSYGAGIYLGGNAPDAFGGSVNIYAYSSGASGNLITFNRRTGAGTVGESARITSDGYWLVGTTLAGLSRVFHNNSGANTFQVANLSTNTSSSAMEVNVAYTGNTTGWFIRGGDDAVYRFYIYTNGNIVNSNGSYGTISDAKVKTDIVDAGSQWDDFKAVRFRKFKMKDDPTGLVQLGVVAQELEQTSPGLVDEHADRDAKGNDLGTTTKSVKTSVLLMKAAVALQEAMLRIENLEAEVNALKAN